MVKQLVPDELWMIIDPLMPPAPPKLKGGRPRVPNGEALAGIIYVLKSGIHGRCSLRDWALGAG
jgi:transposase